MKEVDSLTRFVFEQGTVRGMFVHLDATWQAVLERHDYPPVVRDQLGQFLAAGALLASTIKYDGSLTMQILGNGPINMMLAEFSSKGTLRGLATWREVPEPGSLNALFGDGRLVFTVDTENGGDSYQGIVSLEGDTLAQAIENYFDRSEQLATRLWLVTDESQASGMLLQQMPTKGDADDADLWNRAVILASTIAGVELTRLSPQTLLHRLFHEEDVRLFDSELISFRCTCSRERVRNMLQTLGSDEVHSIIAERGQVDVTCEFCNQRYDFDAVDVEEIFAAAASPPVPPTRH